MRDILQIILATIERDRMLVSLPFGIAKLQALFLQFAPGAFKLTPDQVELLRSDNVVSEAAKAAELTLEGSGSCRTRWRRSCRNISGASVKPASFAHKSA